jgi:hypothetical protein
MRERGVNSEKEKVSNLTRGPEKDSWTKRKKDFLFNLFFYNNSQKESRKKQNLFVHNNRNGSIIKVNKNNINKTGKMAKRKKCRACLHQ